MSKQTQSEGNALFNKLRSTLALWLLILLVVFLGSALYFDHRLESFQNSLEYRPPQESSDEEPIEHQASTHVPLSPVLQQLVYVPAYSHIYHGNGEAYLLTVTLSVRNTSIDKAILVKSIQYFDTKGKAVKSYLNKPLRLSPLATTEVLVKRDDQTGGSGANFLVEWSAEEAVTPPIIEAVMIDTVMHQGISFARQGQVISEVR